MVSNIGVNAYQNNASLLSSNSSLVQQNIPVTAASSQNTSGTQTSTSSGGSDQVTLSPAVEEARLRDSLGLPITGRLTRQALTTQIQTDQDAVRKAFQAKLQEMNLDPNSDISLSLDGNGQIQVSGAGANAASLTKALNADTDFKKMFSRLATNSNLMDYADPTKDIGSSATLIDYLDNSDTADSNLSAMIKKYDAARVSGSSLSSLITLSNESGNAFTFCNNASQQQSTTNTPDTVNSLNTVAGQDLATILQEHDSTNSGQIQTTANIPTLTDYLSNDATDLSLT